MLHLNYENCKHIVLQLGYIRQLVLYSTDDGSRQGFFYHVGGKKDKTKIPWPDGFRGKKNKKRKN